jgi:hypothetical protein
MERRPLVVLLGGSLLMDGIAVSLVDREMPGTIRVDSDVVDIREHLKTLQPDLVIFELGTPTSTAILPLLSQQPGIQLMGLDPACSRIIVLNSQQHLTPTMNELYQVVQAETAKRVHSPQVHLSQVNLPQAHLPKGGEATTHD